VIVFWHNEKFGLSLCFVFSSVAAKTQNIENVENNEDLIHGLMVEVLMVVTAICLLLYQFIFCLLDFAIYNILF
jgi:hypothetical protein